MSLAVKLNPVKSSRISAIGFKEETNTLVILFMNSKAYSYTPVSLDTYNEILTAESVGKYFEQHIKTNPNIKCQQL